MAEIILFSSSSKVAENLTVVKEALLLASQLNFYSVVFEVDAVNVIGEAVNSCNEYSAYGPFLRLIVLL